MAPSPLAIRPRQHHRLSTRSRRPTSGLPGRTGEPLAMDHATSPRIRRAHPARGNNRPRQRVGHQGRAHTDRGRMVRALGPPSQPLPKTGDKTVWWWNPPQASARWWWWCRVYHQGKYTPDGVTFRQYGPAARFDHHHPADPPVIDTTGRRILYVGEDLATSACEVFGDAGIAAICPNYRVAIIAPTTKLVMYDLAAEGAAMAIGALPALSDGNEARSLTSSGHALSTKINPQGPKPPAFITARATTAASRWRCGIAMPASKSCMMMPDIDKTWRSPTRAFCCA